MITKTIIENVLIIAAEGFWLSQNSSQLKRLVRTRNTKGLSASAQTIHAAGNIAWAAYFISRHLWVPVVTNLSMMVITVTTLAYILGNKRQFIKGLFTITAVGPFTAYVLLAFTGASGWLGVAYNNIANAPWLIRVIRTKKSSGISEKSLYYSIGALLCTLTYAFLINSIQLEVGCYLGIIFTAVIMRYYYHYKNRL